MRLIDADALHEKANGLNWTGRSVIQHALRVSPTIEAEPVRHGRWVVQDEGRTRFMCSECKAKNYDGSGRYCPNCGAKMDGDTE